MNQLLIKDKFLVLTVFIYCFFTCAWIVLHLFVENETLSNLYSDTYGVLALIGSLSGFYLSRIWGGVKSYMGKSILYLSAGLLFQFLGQVVYTIYYYKTGIDAPYPSWGDLFYFGSIPLYVVGAYYLAKSSGIGFTLSLLRNKLLALILPAILLFFSYWVFLRGMPLDFSNYLKLFLDIGYPLGQSLYLAVALLTLFLSTGQLGGVMKGHVLLILTSFVIQYLADFVFLYTLSRNVWTSGGFSELIYLNAYFLMALSLISLRSAYTKLNKIQ